MWNVYTAIDTEFCLMGSQINLPKEATIADLDREWDIEAGETREEYESKTRNIVIKLDTPVLKAWITHTVDQLMSHSIAYWQD